VHAPRPLLVELANAADDAKALLAIIQSGEARLAVALVIRHRKMTAAAKRLLPDPHGAQFGAGWPARAPRFSE
jgi:hypothetical protein